MMRKENAKINLLDTVPVRSERVITEWEGEYAVLAFPRFKRVWMQRWLFPRGKSSYLRVQLEEHGTAVWQLIDGKRTVREIVALLSEHFAGDESYASRVATYLMRMQKDGFIKLVEGK